MLKIFSFFSDFSKSTNAAQQAAGFGYLKMNNKQFKLLQWL